MTVKQLEKAIAYLKNCLYFQCSGLTSTNFYEQAISLKRIKELQNLIEIKEKELAIQKGEFYITKFGQIVYTEEDLKYYDSIYNAITNDNNSKKLNKK